MMALLMVLYYGDITPRQETPEPIPYSDCIEMAERVAWYFNHTYGPHSQPIVECTLVPITIQEIPQ